MLFVVVALPAMLIPTVSGHEAETSLPPQGELGEADPFQWGADVTPRDFDWELTPEEVEDCLDCYLGE
jgi:hypothetical protein